MIFRPDLVTLAQTRLPSAGAAAHAVHPQSGSGAAAVHTAESSGAQGAVAKPQTAVARAAVNHGAASVPEAKPAHRRLPPTPTAFLGFRITNPTVQKVNLIPPFGHVLVQARQPIPGHAYNILSVAVKNGSAQTFTAKNGFTVTFPGQHHWFPILTGDQVWKPGRWIVFYVLTKKYYPLRSQISGGFLLNLGGRITTLVPGPSAIFLRLKYNPETFGRTLDWIVAFGQGAQLGKGPPFGLPDTKINQIVAARTRRMDFGGHF
jgi:hypothetical protein